MPHLSEMQARHADDGVTIIGVSREDKNNSLEAVRKMTADKGDIMAYTVAWDDAGKTYADYMTASGQRGIPTSFLIDREGNVAYIGHPANMDRPLAMVVAGTWDPLESPKDLAAMQSAQSEILRGAMGLSKEGAAKHLEKIADFQRRWPGMAESLDGVRYQVLVLAEQHADAAELGRKVVQKAIEAKDAMALNQLAWGIVDPEVANDHRDVGLALHAATVAANLGGYSDPAILDTLARAHFWLGGYERALELQEKAVALAKEDPAMKGLLPGLQVALEEYRALAS